MLVKVVKQHQSLVCATASQNAAISSELWREKSNGNQREKQIERAREMKKEEGKGEKERGEEEEEE